MCNSVTTKKLPGLERCVEFGGGTNINARYDDEGDAVNCVARERPGIGSCNAVALPLWRYLSRTCADMLTNGLRIQRRGRRVNSRSAGVSYKEKEWNAK